VSAPRRLLLVLVLALAAAARADEESALYFLGRAKEALAANDLDKAAEFLEKSAHEKEGYPPTLVALAELAKRRGDRESAVKYLNDCLERRGSGDPTKAEREAFAAAEKMLGELDAAGAQFRKLVADYLADVVRLARNAKDPAFAKECWRTVLLLDPDNKEARDGMAAADTASRGGAPPAGTPLFNGKDLDGWIDRRSPWSVEDGILRGRIDGASANRTEKPLTGDYTLTCEMRVKEDVGGEPIFGILFGMKGTYDHFGLFMWDESWRIERHFEEHRRSDLARCTYKHLSGKFSRNDWHTYRIEVEGKRIRAFVDDREIGDTRAADRGLDGPVGFWLQDLAVEIRSFAVEQKK